MSISYFKICVIIFQALTIPEHLEAPFKIIRNACIEQSNVDEKYILESKDGYIPDVPELKCYILCLLEFAGAIDDDGTIHFGDVMHLLSPDLKESIMAGMEICATKRIYIRKKSILIYRIQYHCTLFSDGNTRCETAYLTAKCYYKLMPEVNNDIQHFEYQNFIESKFRCRAHNYHKKVHHN